MHEEVRGAIDSDMLIHDEVFIQCIDRKERIIKFIIGSLGIPEQSAREDSIIAEVLEQLIRENNQIIDALQNDIRTYVYEWMNTEEEYNVRSSDTRSINDTYDRQKAKIYIDTYWKNYNSSYPAFDFAGGDCANFVSQVLYAGGMKWADDGNPEHYTWYTNWYCKPGATSKDGDRRITLSWKVAAAFKSHWIKRAAKSLMLGYSEAIEKIDDIVKQVYIGDVVQFCYSNGVPWHTLAVTGFTYHSDINKNDVVLASHTKDSNSRSLLKTLEKYPHDYKLRIYIIKESE